MTEREIESDSKEEKEGSVSKNVVYVRHIQENVAWWHSNWVANINSSISINQENQLIYYILIDPPIIGSIDAIHSRAAILRIDQLEDRIGIMEEHLQLIRPVLGKFARSWELEPEDIVPQALLPVEGSRKQEIMIKGKQTIEEIIEQFDDTLLRLNKMITLKSIAREIWLLARETGDKYLKQVASMLYDCLKPLHSEEVKKTQMEAIAKVWEIICKGDVDITDAKKTHDILISANLEYMPFLKAKINEVDELIDE